MVNIKPQPSNDIMNNRQGFLDVESKEGWDEPVDKGIAAPNPSYPYQKADAIQIIQPFMIPFSSINEVLEAADQVLAWLSAPVTSQEPQNQGTSGS